MQAQGSPRQLPQLLLQQQQAQAAAEAAQQQAAVQQQLAVERLLQKVGPWFGVLTLDPRP